MALGDVTDHSIKDKHSREPQMRVASGCFSRHSPPFPGRELAFVERIGQESRKWTDSPQYRQHLCFIMQSHSYRESRD